MRGLKWINGKYSSPTFNVASHADAWIEIDIKLEKCDCVLVASHADAWIEI